jgi:hypothetical protein
MAEVDTRITPALHPDNIASLDGYNDSTAPLVADATEALEAAYGYLGGIHDVRAAAFADPTLTKEAALLKADDHAQAKLAGVTRKFDAAVARFGTTIASLEADLSASVKEQAGRTVSGEVRALMQKSNDRVGLMEKALAEGDDEVLSAVLGAPPMLSGLTKEIHAVFLRKYNEQRKPETMQRLRALQSAKTYLEQQGGLVLREMMKAVGGLPVIDERTGKVIREDGPQAIRAKRDKSAAVYARHS